MDFQNPTQNSFFDYSGSSLITQAGAGKFGNPFMDIASEYIPRDLRQIFELVEFIYLTYGTYKSAAKRVVSYFLTEIVLDGGGEDERDEVKTFMDKKLHLLSSLSDIGLEYLVYGNSFISIYFPFDRFLKCPQCKTEYHVSTIKYKFEVGKKSFVCTCVNKSCGYIGAFDREDRRSLDKSRVRLKRWNPKLMRLRYHEISGETEYFMELEPLFVKRVEDGNPFYLDRCPWEIVECIADRKKSDTPLFRFAPDAIYHLKESSLMGLPIRGWAIPPLMANFRLAYYIQILRRYDEALAFDFIVPFRILYPDAAPNSQGIDALQATSMSMFLGHMQSMVKNHRKDPTDVAVAPFKVGYQMVGGEGKTLAPKDNIALAIDELLNAVGFPAELYKGTLQIQAFPVALRLFEKTWGNMVDGFNDLIGWTVEKVSRYFGWGELTGSLRSVTLADDIERKALQLQASAGMDISKGTAYRPLGIDYMEEQKKVVDEQKKIQELQQEAMSEAQVAQGEGQGSGGQSGAASSVGATPGDVQQQGKDLAYQLVTQTPENMRRGELIKIKQSNPTLHAIVLQQMDELRRSMARDGQAMMLQQAQQGGGQTKMAEWNMEDMKSLPSPLRLSLLLADQVMDYRRSDMKKIAMDIKRGIVGADIGFRYIYRGQMGLD